MSTETEEKHEEGGTARIASSDLLAYDIWSEGYLCTGCEGIPVKAKYHGKFHGKDFREACKTWAKSNGEDYRFYNEDRNSYWGCRLFDNEKEARASFG